MDSEERAYRKGQIIRRAFLEELQEGVPLVGTLVGAFRQFDEDDKLTYRLESIGGGMAVCSLPDGTVREFRANEIADINKVKSRAILLAITELTDELLVEAGVLM